VLVLRRHVHGVSKRHGHFIGARDGTIRTPGGHEENDMYFPCIKCGLCCRTLKFIPAAAVYHNGDGVCRYLKNDLCSIYENRPEICNVERMYDAYFRKIMDEKTFIRTNLIVCLKLADGDFKRKAKIRKLIKRLGGAGL
jgi:Fe-S-cluster containining protein